MRHRNPDAIETYVRHWVRKGRRQFLVVDDNFARSPIWREVTEIFARAQADFQVELDVFIQIDTLATKVKGFVEACLKAGVRRVFIGMESVRPENLAAASKGQNKVHQMRDMLMEWKTAGVMIYAGYIVGFPSDTPQRVAEDMAVLQHDLPIDILEMSLLTPFPGSADHKILVEQGAGFSQGPFTISCRYPKSAAAWSASMGRLNWTACIRSMPGSYGCVVGPCAAPACRRKALGGSIAARLASGSKNRWAMAA
jgi:hypothetical protein